MVSQLNKTQDINWKNILLKINHCIIKENTLKILTQHFNQPQFAHLYGKDLQTTKIDMLKKIQEDKSYVYNGTRYAQLLTESFPTLKTPSSLPKQTELDSMFHWESLSALGEAIISIQNNGNL